MPTFAAKIVIFDKRTNILSPIVCNSTTAGNSWQTLPKAPINNIKFYK
jgi:hypothetical protein